MTLLRFPSAMPRPWHLPDCPRTAPFWEALRGGHFLLARCNACGKLDFPPRNTCPYCGSDDQSWQESTGEGVLYAATRIHAAGARFASMTPYSAGLVDLSEGVRILTRLLPSASSLAPDSPVKLVIVDHIDGPLFAAVSAHSENLP